MVMMSCVSKTEYERLRTEYDSIAMLNLVYQDQAYETDSLVAAVISSFQELSMAETMINVNALRGKLPATEQRRIRENVKLLAARLDESNKAMEMLIQRVENNHISSGRMLGTISLLKEQLDRQQQRVATIMDETITKVNGISALDASMKRLKDEVARMKSYNALELQRLKLVEDSLNTVYYAMGTKDDLKEMRLLTRDGHVSVDNAELSYLTKVDKRQLREVVLRSKRARILSIHPHISYTMKKDNKGYLSLEILDEQKFWSFSHIMLVEVDF